MERQNAKAGRPKHLLSIFPASHLPLSRRNSARLKSCLGEAKGKIGNNTNCDWLSTLEKNVKTWENGKTTRDTLSAYLLTLVAWFFVPSLPFDPESCDPSLFLRKIRFPPRVLGPLFQRHRAKGQVLPAHIRVRYRQTFCNSQTINKVRFVKATTKQQKKNTHDASKDFNGRPKECLLRTVTHWHSEKGILRWQDMPP